MEGKGAGVTIHFALPNLLLRHDSHDVGAEGGRTDQRAGQAVAAVELDHRAHQTSSTLLEITRILPSSTIAQIQKINEPHYKCDLGTTEGYE